MSEIPWNYAKAVGNDSNTLAPIFYKEGVAVTGVPVAVEYAKQSA